MGEVPQPQSSRDAETTVIVGALLANLFVASTVIPMRGSLSADYTKESVLINAGLNAVAILPLLASGWRYRATGIVGGWKIKAFIALYIASAVINVANASRATSSILYVLTVLLAITRPTLLAKVGRSLIESARWIALAFGGMVATLNWDQVTWTFYYPKSLAREGHWFSLPYRNPNMLSVQLDTVILLLAVATVSQWGRWSRSDRAVAAVAWIVLINVQMATLSRGGVAQLIATSGIVLWAIYHQVREEHVLLRKATRILAALAVLVLAGLLATIDLRRAEDAAVADFVIEKSGNMLSTRQLTTDAIGQLLSDKKLFAFGAGSGRDEVTNTDLVAYEGGSAHNTYVSVALQYGVPLLLAWVVLLVHSIRRGRLGSQDHELTATRWLMYAALLHPMTEAVFFFRFGVATDVVFLSLIAAGLHRAKRVGSPDHPRQRTLVTP